MQPLTERIKPLYPFDAHYIELEGHRMHYVDAGRGPVVLMVHGNPTWSFYYRRLIASLSSDFRVIAPDHMGCGLSDKPQQYRYTLAKHIQNLSALIAHLGVDTFSMIVHDWGGAIGLGHAVEHPQAIERLVVLNTAAFAGPMPWRLRLCRMPILGAWMVRGLNGFARSAFLLKSVLQNNVDPQVKAGYLLPYDSYQNRIAIHRFVQDIPLNPSHPSYPTLQKIDSSLEKLRDIPMLIGWGMRDFCFNETFLNEWVRRFPNAVVHRFEDAGHYVLEDAHVPLVPRVRQFLVGEFASISSLPS